MKISVIVPVYNIQNYIGICLETLCNQNVDEKHCEIIVIDDGSTDNSGTIIDEYAKKHTVIKAFHKTNGGVSSARNVGLKQANGDYIWFVDGDDMVARGSISIILNCLKDNNYPDLLFLGVKSLETESNVPLALEPLCIAEETKKYSGWMFTRIMKADIIRKNNILFDIDVALGEDDIFCEFFQHHITSKFKLDMILYFYRQRRGSALHMILDYNNIEKVVKSYSRSIYYANTYDFFWYKRDMVYKNMPNVMAFIARQPRKKSRELLKLLKNYQLFPLPKIKGIESDALKKSSGAKKMRDNAFYSLLNYYILRIYVKLWNNNH